MQVYHEKYTPLTIKLKQAIYFIANNFLNIQQLISKVTLEPKLTLQLQNKLFKLCGAFRFLKCQHMIAGSSFIFHRISNRPFFILKSHIS